MKTVDFAHLPLKPGDIVLDLGCGEGRHVISAYVEADVQSVGVDLSLDDLKITRERFVGFAEPENDAKSFGLSSASALDRTTSILDLNREPMSFSTARGFSRHDCTS